MVNDHDTRVVFLQGFQGIGKGALANEALRRFFQGSSAVYGGHYERHRSRGIGPQIAPRGIRQCRAGSVWGRGVGIDREGGRTYYGAGQFIIFRDCQHWLDDEQRPQEPLPTVIRQAKFFPKLRRIHCL